MKSISEILSGEQLRPAIIAHRGASHYHHENTMDAFSAAVDMRAEIVEFDVRRTADGTLIIHHDPDIGGVEIGKISVNQVNTVAAASGFSVPSFADVLSYCDKRILVDIELKEGGYEEQVLDEVLKALDPERFIITSVHDRVLRKVKDLKREVRTGLIIGSRPRSQLLTKLFPGARARRAEVDVVVVSQKLLKFGFLATSKKLRLPVWVYTVNDRKKLWDLITDERIGGIFTDRPDVALFLRDLHAVSQSKETPPSIKVSE